jgi:hypothetical protein
MAWQIEHEGNTWHEEELTLAEAEQIERATGESWFSINPFRSAKHCNAILTVLLQSRCGKAEGEASAIAGAYTVKQLIGDEGIIRLVDSTQPVEFENGNPTQTEP